MLDSQQPVHGHAAAPHLLGQRLLAVLDRLLAAFPHEVLLDLALGAGVLTKPSQSRLGPALGGLRGQDVHQVAALQR
ncbi:MAG: hypothetical protein IPL43_04740 [Micropruina sp.]|nr:hypothetical protein [Micropruina sp.]